MGTCVFRISNLPAPYLDDPHQLKQGIFLRCDIIVGPSGPGDYFFNHLAVVSDNTSCMSSRDHGHDRDLEDHDQDGKAHSMMQCSGQIRVSSMQMFNENCFVLNRYSIAAPCPYWLPQWKDSKTGAKIERLRRNVWHHAKTSGAILYGGDKISHVCQFRRSLGAFIFLR